MTLKELGLSDEEVQDIVATLINAAGNLSSTYDDANDKLTLDTSGLNTEEVQDAVATLVTAGSNLSWSYDDANDTLTVSLANSISVNTLEAADGTFNNSITGPSNKTITTELATISDTAREQAVDNTDNILSLQEALAETRFDLGLAKLDYDDGLFDTFIDNSNITLGSPAPFRTFGVDGFVSVGSGWQLSNASFIQSPSFSSRDSFMYGMEFVDGGERLYLLGNGNDNVYQYSLSTKYDPSTASFVQSLDVSASVSVPNEIIWKDSGDKFFIIDSGTNNLNEYSLSTTWDISTATLENELNIESDSNLTDARFNNDGTELFVLDNSTNHIYKWTLSVAYDTTTASVANPDYDWSSEIDGDVLTFTWGDGGSRLYLVESDSTNFVHEFSPDSKYGLTLTLDQSVSVDSNTSGEFLRSIEWQPNGSTLWILSDENSETLEYTATGTSSPSSFSESTSLGFTPSKVVVSDERSGGLTVSYDIQDSNGNTVTVSNSEVGDEVDVSSLANGDVTITVTLDSSDPTPDDQLDSFGTYFN